MTTEMTTETTSETTTSPILGIHHVTAIAGDPQANVDFYAGVLGLRLVKKTVNFDDPRTYHLYYGDRLGSPGSIMTFFPWPGARRGQMGAGQTQVTGFSVPAGSLGAWRARFGRVGIGTNDIERFGVPGLELDDPDGLRLELVATAADDDPRPAWDGGGVPVEHAIRGFDGVTLLENDGEKTVELLVDAMGYREIGTDGALRRFESGDGGSGTRVDLRIDPNAVRGNVAGGSVHHIAFRVADDEAQVQWQERLFAQGHPTTEVKDRNYFHSIYFREPGGVLFELATDPPGFTIDESEDELGTTLRLPEWYESARDRIELVLPPLRDPEVLS